MDDVINVSYTSFIAGALLVDKDISNLDISQMSSDFEEKFSVEFSEDDAYQKIEGLVCLDYDGFHLRCNYDDIIEYNNNKYSVYDYLYSLTNDLVRTYFNSFREFSLDKEEKKIKKLK